MAGPQRDRSRSPAAGARAAAAAEPQRVLGRIRWYSGRKQLGVVKADEGRELLIPPGGAAAGNFVPPNAPGLMHGTRVSFLVTSRREGRKTTDVACDVRPIREEGALPGLECGVETLMGGREVNEDRMLANDLYDLGFLAGIFDGHGGAQCADYVSQRLAVAVHEAFSARAAQLGRALETVTVFQEEDLIVDSLREAFETTDAEWLRQARAGNLQCGSTGLAVLVAHGFEAVNRASSVPGCYGGVAKLFVANCGDCRAVLARGSKAVRLSEDHKPELKEEMRRIESSGGIVMQAGSGAFRVGRKTGENRMFLSTSRSFGDLNLKEPQPLVISTPDVTVHNLQPEDCAVIMGCDGVWDALQDQDAVDVALRTMSQDGAGAVEAARAVAKAAHRTGSRDNITVFVMRLAWSSLPKL